MKLVLQQKQTLNLLMTVELRQAIELLQYTTVELEQYIREQAIENPLIELQEVDQMETFSVRDRAFTQPIRTKNANPIEASPSTRNAREELIDQVGWVVHDIATKKLLQTIIHQLDEHGYLQMNEQLLIQYEEEEIEHAIHQLQKIGPLGIGARSLKECLRLQVQYGAIADPLLISFIEEHLENVANRKWNEIATSMQISLAKVQALYEALLSLHPRPCVLDDHIQTNYTIPDIIVEKKDGRFVFYLYDRYLPKVRMQSIYQPYLYEQGEITHYLSQQYKKMQWLLTSIEQRNKTLTAIMEVLLKKQAHFFSKGFIALQPLTLKEVSAELEMHESTISRAVSKKIIQTPLGTFALRDLFTSKVQTADGEGMAQTRVKALLKRYIAQEDKSKPYSDQKIADYLKSKGITISRRTVSKYREELKIPTSSKRKEIRC